MWESRVETCRSKRAFRSKAKARRFLADLTLPAGGKAGLRIYECGECGRYHTTSSVSKAVTGGRKVDLGRIVVEWDRIPPPEGWKVRRFTALVDQVCGQRPGPMWTHSRTMPVAWGAFEAHGSARMVIAFMSIGPESAKVEPNDAVFSILRSSPRYMDGVREVEEFPWSTSPPPNNSTVLTDAGFELLVPPWTVVGGRTCWEIPDDWKLQGVQ